jgi:hypothetical protein
MYRPIPVSSRLYRNALTAFPVVLIAVLIAGCAEDDIPTAPTDPPVEIQVLLEGTLTPNGGRTHEFVVQRAGNVSATITALTPTEAVVGMSLGPLSVQACTASVARDNATNGVTLTGTATSTGAFCLRVFDAGGTLTGPVDYAITLRHF